VKYVAICVDTCRARVKWKSLRNRLREPDESQPRGPDDAPNLRTGSQKAAGPHPKGKLSGPGPANYNEVILSTTRFKVDIAGINSAVMSPSTRTGDAVAISVQKKAMEVQAESAMQLIEAAKVQNTPSGSLGANLDVYA
jgi:hypothetical protein